MIKLLSLNNLGSILILLIIDFGCSTCYSQNLISNGSFENYINVDCTYGGFDQGTFPNAHVVNSWYTYQSPDYYNSICPSSGWYGVPSNAIGYSPTKEGNAYGGFILFQANTELKEYIYQQLGTPLQSGHTYYLSFYVSRSDGITHAIHSIGAYFSSSLGNGAAGYINAMPQVINQNGFISDTTNWTEIRGCFTANGSEQYVTIGNFNSNANTDTLFVGSNNPTASAYKYAYYYIDDVTLIDQTTVGFIEQTISSKFNVFPNPNNGLMQLDYDLGAESGATMSLLDVTGKLVKKYNLQNTKGTLQINEQNLSNGIYFYRILVGEKIIKTDKIVIIK